jgi:hypothetical protein
MTCEVMSATVSLIYLLGSVDRAFSLFSLIRQKKNTNLRLILPLIKERRNLTTGIVGKDSWNINLCLHIIPSHTFLPVIPPHRNIAVTDGSAGPRLSQTLESWAPIPLEAWISFCVYSLYVLSCA